MKSTLAIFLVLLPITAIYAVTPIFRSPLLHAPLQDKPLSEAIQRTIDDVLLLSSYGVLKNKLRIALPEHGISDQVLSDARKYHHLTGKYVRTSDNQLRLATFEKSSKSTPTDNVFLHAMLNMLRDDLTMPKLRSYVDDAKLQIIRGNSEESVAAALSHKLFNKEQQYRGIRDGGKFHIHPEHEHIQWVYGDTGHYSVIVQPQIIEDTFKQLSDEFPVLQSQIQESAIQQNGAYFYTLDPMIRIKGELPILEFRKRLFSFEKDPTARQARIKANQAIYFINLDSHTKDLEIMRRKLTPRIGNTNKS